MAFDPGLGEGEEQNSCGVLKVCDMKTGVANSHSGRWFLCGTTGGSDKLFARGIKKKPKNMVRAHECVHFL